MHQWSSFTAISPSGKSVTRPIKSVDDFINQKCTKYYSKYTQQFKKALVISIKQCYLSTDYSCLPKLPTYCN